MAGGVALALVSGVVGGLVVEFVGGSGSKHRETVTIIGADPAGLGSRPPDTVSGVADTVLPSVVSVSVSDATGSGFVISTDGFILTNNHVIASVADGGSIELGLFDGRRVDAEIVGRSPSYDLAVLRTEAGDLQPVVFGDSATVAVGDPVIAVGSPLGLEGTVTSGIISALNRPVTAGGASEQSYINALQTDAAINPGNSGGPLVDGAGRVIGVNSAIASLGMGAEVGSIGLGFAIPIDQAQRTAEQLITDGEAVYPVMGVLLDDAFTGRGARVAQDSEDAPAVTPDGPAAAVGIEAGDVITHVDGDPVDTPGELVVVLRSHEPGDDVTLVVQHDGEPREVVVTLGSAVG